MKKRETSSGNCRYCNFRVPGEEKVGKFRSKIRKHNKSKHFVCEICQKKHDNKDGLDAHMSSLHKNIEGMVICAVNGCERKMQRLQTVLMHVRLDHDGGPLLDTRKKSTLKKRRKRGWAGQGGNKIYQGMYISL